MPKRKRLQPPFFSRHKHIKHTVVLLSSIILGFTFLSWGVQQLDMMLSPLVYEYAMGKEWWFPLRGWFGFRTTIPNAYVYMIYLIYAGWIVTIVGVVTSLWFWKD